MKLPIEKWIDERNMLYSEESDAIELLKESIMCYKIGAYRSSYIMAYLAFETIVKNRILNTNDAPASVPVSTWENIKRRLKDDNIWEEELSNVITQGPPAQQSGRPDIRLFKYRNHDAMVNQYRHWKNIRNACAHYKHNTINHSTVECFWNFVIDDLEEYHVGGSLEYFTSSIIDSFNISKSDEKDDYRFEISKLLCLMDTDEFEAFLLMIDVEYQKLSNRAVEKNYELFFNQLTLSENKIIRDALYKYLASDPRNVCDKLIYFYDNYRYFIEEYLRSSVDYKKNVWDRYLFYLSYYNEQPWRIFEIYSSNNLLSEQELNIFFEKVVGINHILRDLLLRIDEEKVQLLIEKGLSKVLSSKVKNINFCDFDTANSNEDLLFCAIKYCLIDQQLYDDTYFLLKKRQPGRTMYDTITDLLTNNIDIKNKYIEFENTANRSDVSSFFGW